MKHVLFFLLSFVSLASSAQVPIPCWPNAPFLPWDIFNVKITKTHNAPLSYKGIGTQADTVIQPRMPVVQLPENRDIHFISPEPIQYVDISTKNIIGDLPLKNVLRIRYKDSGKAAGAVITIAGEKFIAQYHILPGGQNVPAEIDIQPSDTRPLDISGIGLSQNELRQLALGMFLKKPGKPKDKSRDFGIYGAVNHIYTLGDYIFIDLSFHNETSLKFDIEQFRFRIDDKKVNKATNVQSVDIQPLMALLDNTTFNKNYRNIYVLRKLSFPGNKVLHIELSEKQISGRILHLEISYRDILNADTIPN